MWSGADASYLAAITAAGRKYTWHGTLTDANGTTYNFDAEDIVKGSGQISKMVSSDTSLDIGTVYTSELTIRLYLAVNRYVLFGGTIDLYCDVDVNGATYSVPMGEYIIASCTQEMACISITAYDAMTKLDSVNVVQDLGASTPYAWITYFLSRAGLTLGTAQATIEAMPNGTELLTFTNCNTELAAMPCRDALAYMCMILCANAYVGRDGKVYIQQYSMTADDDIAANERFSSSFSDFTTNYTSVTLGIHATGTTEYYAQPTDDGLNYDLGANPWLQAGSAAERETMCRAILADLNGVSYEPYTVSIPIRPELDPMDVLTFSGNQASTDKGAVTSVVYKLGGAMTIKCSGENPRLAGAKSKTQKSLTALTSTVAKEINQMSVVQNSSAVTCGENTETSILTYNFEVTQAENTTMVDVSVVMTSSASETEANDVYTLSDIVAHLSFYVDGSEVNVYAPEFIVDEGKDTMTFNYSLSGLSVGAHQFDVRLMVDGGSGSIAVGDVHELLWGYGITFEVYVKGIAVTTMPTKSIFFVGQTLDYSGIVVSEVYNNGQLNNVTTACTFEPSDGIELTDDDIGTISVVVEKDEFSTSFDVLVKKMLYRVICGENVWSSGSRYRARAFVYNGQIWIWGLAVSSNKVYSAWVTAEMDDSHALVRTSSVTTSTSSVATNYTYRCGCRFGDRWYSISDRTSTVFALDIFSDSKDVHGGTVSISYRYTPDPNNIRVIGINLNTIGVPVVYVVDGYLVFPKVWAKIENGSAVDNVTSMAWLIPTPSPLRWLYVDGADTEDEILANNPIMQSDGIATTPNPAYNNAYETRYFYDLNDGILDIYYLSCDENGPSKTLVDTITTSMPSITKCRQILESSTLVFCYASTDERICGVYDVENHSYREFEFEQSDDVWTWTYSQMGRILWYGANGVFIVPTDDDGEYKLMYSSDLENWSVSDKVGTEDYVIEAEDLTNYGNYVIGTILRTPTASDNVYCGVTLDFTNVG